MDIFYTDDAGDYLRTLDMTTRLRILNKMRFFADQPNPLIKAKHLSGHNAYRFRIGDHRVVCRVVDGILLVLLMDKRDGVYKGL